MRVGQAVKKHAVNFFEVGWRLCVVHGQFGWGWAPREMRV